MCLRQVGWSFPSVECQRCGRPAPRLWDATRVAIDIDLDHSVVLAVQVSLHVRTVCGRMFRGQPPFLHPRAIYTQRVVQKAIEAVYRDGMAMRCVPDHLARDVRVKPDEKMVRLWRRALAAQIDFAVDHQAWVIANFSGILCVDEVYQGDLALLLTVDPAAADGDRLVAYTLLPKTREVNQTMVKPSSSAWGLLRLVEYDDHKRYIAKRCLSRLPVRPAHDLSKKRNGRLDANLVRRARRKGRVLDRPANR